MNDFPAFIFILYTEVWESGEISSDLLQYLKNKFTKLSNFSEKESEVHSSRVRLRKKVVVFNNTRGITSLRSAFARNSVSVFIYELSYNDSTLVETRGIGGQKIHLKLPRFESGFYNLVYFLEKERYLQKRAKNFKL